MKKDRQSSGLFSCLGRELEDWLLSCILWSIEGFVYQVWLVHNFVVHKVLGGRYTNASEVIRAGLRRLEEDEQKIAALRAAIEEGEASGYVEDFDFESHLEELKAKRRNNG